MIQTTGQIWLIIAVLAIGTFLVRYSFLGLIGDRAMPEWVLRLLRYTAVAVLPGLVAPLVLWPAAAGGQPDPVRLSAAIVTILVGAITRNTLATIGAGAVVLVGGLLFLG